MKGKKTINKKDGTDSFDDYGTNSNPKNKTTVTTVVTNDDVEEAVRESHGGTSYIRERIFERKDLPNFFPDQRDERVSKRREWSYDTFSGSVKEVKRVNKKLSIPSKNVVITTAEIHNEEEQRRKRSSVIKKGRHVSKTGTGQFQYKNQPCISNEPDVIEVLESIEIPVKDTKEEESSKNISMTNTTVTTVTNEDVEEALRESHGGASYIHERIFERKDLPNFLPDQRDERVSKGREWSYDTFSGSVKEVKRVNKKLSIPSKNIVITTAEIHNEEQRRKTPSVIKKDRHVSKTGTGQFQYKNQPCISNEPDVIEVLESIEIPVKDTKEEESSKNISMTNTTVTTVTNEDVEEALRESHGGASYIHERIFERKDLPNFLPDQRDERVSKRREWSYDTFSGSVKEVKRVNKKLSIPSKNIVITTAEIHNEEQRRKTPSVIKKDRHVSKTGTGQFQYKNQPCISNEPDVIEVLESIEIPVKDTKEEESSKNISMTNTTVTTVTNEDVEEALRESTVRDERVSKGREWSYDTFSGSVKEVKIVNKKLSIPSKIIVITTAEIHNEEQRRKTPSVIKKDRHVSKTGTGQFQYKNQPCISNEPDVIEVLESIEIPVKDTKEEESSKNISMTNTTVTTVTNEDVEEALRESHGGASYIHERIFERKDLPNFLPDQTDERVSKRREWSYDTFSGSVKEVKRVNKKLSIPSKNIVITTAEIHNEEQRRKTPSVIKKDRHVVTSKSDHRMGRQTPKKRPLTKKGIESSVKKMKTINSDSSFEVPCTVADVSKSRRHASVATLPLRESPQISLSNVNKTLNTSVKRSQRHEESTHGNEMVLYAKSAKQSLIEKKREIIDYSSDSSSEESPVNEEVSRSTSNSSGMERQMEQNINNSLNRVLSEFTEEGNTANAREAPRQQKSPCKPKRRIAPTFIRSLREEPVQSPVTTVVTNEEAVRKSDGDALDIHGRTFLPELSPVPKGGPRMPKEASIQEKLPSKPEEFPVPKGRPRMPKEASIEENSPSKPEESPVPKKEAPEYPKKLQLKKNRQQSLGTLLSQEGDLQHL
ncbi:hypothetical protein TNCV_3478441 [Trichonephila clavipes]|nr:hypothetical protein TNCV_3478441 [Trichonephila clavipes]